jgi:hypothetical protein
VIEQRVSFSNDAGGAPLNANALHPEAEAQHQQDIAEAHGDSGSPAGALRPERRAAIAEILRLLCRAKVNDLLMPALREVASDLTEGVVSNALHSRLRIIAEASGCSEVHDAARKVEGLL